MAAMSAACAAFSVFDRRLNNYARKEIQQGNSPGGISTTKNARGSSWVIAHLRDFEPDVIITGKVSEVPKPKNTSFEFYSAFSKN